MNGVFAAFCSRIRIAAARLDGWAMALPENNSTRRSGRLRHRREANVAVFLSARVALAGCWGMHLTYCAGNETGG
jgi:hypothetical protein